MPGIFRRIYFILILLTWFNLTGLIAAPYRVNVLEGFNGKKGEGANCLLQDSEGFIWIGSNSGLTCFNGSVYLTFRKEDGLADDHITSLCLDRQGCLWIGHNNGKVSLRKNGKFSHFPYNNQLPAKPLNAITESGGIWLSLYGNGIYHYNNEKLTLLNSDKGMPDNSVYQIVAAEANTVFAGTDAGLVKIIYKAQKFSISHFSSKEGLPDNIIRSMTIGKPGELWIAMQDSGVCLFNITAGKFVSGRKSWKHGAISSLIYDANNRLIAATEEKGLLWNNKPGEDFSFVPVNPSLESRLKQVICDYQQNIWVAGSGGLFMLNRPRFNLTDPLKDINIISVCHDKEGRIYCSSRDAIYLNYQNKIFAVHEPLEHPQEQITCIKTFLNDELLVGTAGAGLYRISREGRVLQHLGKAEGLLNPSISCLETDFTGAIWVGTLGGGVTRLYTENGKFRIDNLTRISDLGGAFVLSLYCDKNNSVWLGTDGGLFQYVNDDFVNVTGKFRLQRNSVVSVTGDQQGLIWFVLSDLGVNCYDGNKIINYSTRNGLQDNNPTALLVKNNKVFMVSGKGIDRLDTRNGKVVFYPCTYKETETNLNASVMLPSGSLLTGTVKGLLVFRSGDLATDTITPRVHITGVYVQSKKINKDSISEFPYNQNNFEFEYSACWFGSEQKLKFRYLLSGIDKKENETEYLSASYASLPPGKYTFSVRAQNEEGIWSKPVLFTIYISVPIWQKPWFWAVAVVTLLAVFYIVFRWRLRNLRHERNILEFRVKKRTEELIAQNKLIEEKNKALERLSIVVRETENAVLILDRNGNLEWVNDSFEKKNGISLQQFHQTRGVNIVEFSNNPDIQQIINRCLAQKTSIIYESKNLSGEQEVWNSSTLTPIYHADGSLQNLVIIDTDITERKKNEELIRQKNKDITDSIAYARKIQNTILPDLAYVQKYFKEIFILFLQKDIVSGDFFWFTFKNNKAVIAAVDCTGHGVPGAFMSLIGNNMLQQIVNERGITTPGEILNELNKGIVQSQNSSNRQSHTKDGMDAAICCYDIGSDELTFAGAMRPLYFYRNQKFHEIKGDKWPIGTEPGHHKEITYVTHHLQIARGDVFYIFTDGYADQFGGESGKKLKTKNFKLLLEQQYHLPLAEQKRLLMEAHENWKGSREQVDDILVIGFRLS